jgi:D-lyxose ketol-isomerase
MITKEESEQARLRAAAMMRQAGIVLTEKEAAGIEAADFGLGRLTLEGAQIATLVLTPRIAVRVIALFPGQTLPEHLHPPFGPDPGKEETLRGIEGTVYVCTPGTESRKQAAIPRGKEVCYTAGHETALRPGDQCTIQPGVKHWFQAGPEGAVFYSVSTCLRDATDIFTDPRVVRATQIAY